MKRISSFWHKLRQFDEQAGSLNPWFDFANQSFDRVAARHQRDWKQISRHFRRKRDAG